ncbi:hypothetical protein LTR10_019585 [Elasticomyces elasticus]|uniref:Capsule synthesis protein CapA domain-containing protein n=1 Tax=Exophiala sideris TaxID=1016849 RepID=A0ABR0JNZ2_9EURO|nr:hypothetical protein LTR10_019585 [Elasticomyces elasticus]KAK5038148.1 hypothetical protein LTS07_001617 [Exophiala sideris]KAK5044132.1 hypothetical protein LTR13_000488 [Exophiala sideris]KAK5067632.1 hypothetical protein LTR69_001621 [Exophiala sideris]KAK5184128.1 hypothetical protein LTR44_003634 [Eurotiomycetes sp. CCFEE 6388]
MSTHAPEKQSSDAQTYTLLLLGDYMIGRLIDALLPTSIARQSPESDPEDAANTVDTYILRRNPELKSYNYLSPWGNAVDLVRKSDLVLANLETALTTSQKRWPDKVFNYRSHTDNVKCLSEVGMVGGRGYVSLANNHTLDWCKEGLLETVQTLADNQIEFAGAGRTKEEAATPGILRLGDKWTVKCWSFADHPADWKAVDEFNLIDYSSESRDLMRSQIMAQDSEQENSQMTVGLKVVSMHWGPNYRWLPAKEIVDTAHWLIDECDVDIIHGHSSHHIQGVEVYKGKLIVYGCGDFVDDYAVDKDFRNDLSAAWRITVSEAEDSSHGNWPRLEVKKLEVFPNRIQRFQAHLLEIDDKDHKWIETKFRELCAQFGTRVDADLGPQGQIVVDLKR